MRFLRDLTHFRGLFPPAPGPAAGKVVEEHVDALMPVFDAFGTSRYREITMDVRNAAVNQALIQAGQDVPDDEVWFVPFADVGHDDAAASKLLFFSVRINYLGTDYVITLTEATSTTNLYNHALRGPLLLPPKARLQGRATVAVGAAVVLTLKMAYIPLPLGEYCSMIGRSA